MTEGPFEPDEGQESERPDLDLLLLVVSLTLGDLIDFLQNRRDDRADLIVRTVAVLAIVRRVREARADADDR